MFKSIMSGIPALFALLTIASIPKTSLASDRRIAQDISRLRLDQLTTAKRGEAFLLVHMNIFRFQRDLPGEALPEYYFEIVVNVDKVLSGIFTPRQWHIWHREEEGLPSLFGRSTEREPYETVGESIAIVQVYSANDKVEIRDRYVLPSDWDKFAIEAFRYCADHKELFGDKGTARNDDLINLLHNPNPMLAIASARALAADSSHVPLIIDEIATSKDIRQAGITLVFLQIVKPRPGDAHNDLDSIANLLNGIIKKVQHPRELHGLALAAYCAGPRREKLADAVLTGEVDSSALAGLSAADAFSQSS